MAAANNIELNHRGRNGLTYSEGGTRILNEASGRYIAINGRLGRQIIINAGIVPTRVVGRPAPANYAAAETIVNGMMRQTTYNEVAGPHNTRSIVQYATSILNTTRPLGDTVRSVTIAFQDDEGDTSHRNIRITPETTVATLGNEIIRIQTGVYRQTIQMGERDNSPDLYGSDVVGDGKNLETGSFAVNTRTPVAAGAKKVKGKSHENFVFKYIDYECKEGDCLLAIFRALTEIEIKLRSGLRKLLDIPEGNISTDSIPKLCEYFKVGVEIYTDKVLIEKEFDDNEKENRCIIIESKNELIYEAGKEHKIIAQIYYQPEINHYSHIKEIKDHNICGKTGDNINIVGVRTIKQIKDRILEQGRNYIADRKEYKKEKAPIYEKVRTQEKKQERISKTKLLFFDFETVWDPKCNSKVIPYSVAWFVCSMNEKDRDFTNDEVNISYGLDTCQYELLKFIRSAQDNTKYLLVSFNGSRFDNFILANAAANRDCLTNIFWTTGCIRGMEIGRHSSLDIAKLNPGMSLDKSCNDFKTTPKKVVGFSHLVVQDAFLSGKLDEWLNKNRVEASEYVKTDVLCLASLTMKMRDAFIKLSGLNFLEDANKLGTAGSVAWNALSKSVELPLAESEEVDIFIRKAITGGRTENFMERGFKAIGQYRMVDVKSEYPTVMYAQNQELFDEKLMYGYYPTGQAIKTDKYIENHLGVYRIKVIKQPKINIFARREEGQPLDWKCKEEFETYTTNCSIELLKLNDGECEIYEGYYWTEKSRDLFKGFLKPIFDEKDKQDLLKDNKSSDYNPALRAICKILMNSSSGKTLQRNYDDLCVLVKGLAQQLKAEKKMKNDISDDFIFINKSTGILIGKVKEEEKYNQKKAKPSQLGIFIYEYARTYLYEMLLKKYNPMYCDTDSCLMTQEDYNIFVKDQPQLSKGESLGQIGEELGEYEKCEIILMAPKMYMVCPTINDIPTHKDHIKYKIKGVGVQKDKMILNLKTIEEMTNEELYNEYNNVNSKLLVPINKDPRLIFNELIKGKVNVLCSQMSRHMNDSNEAFIIKQRFLIKSI